MYKIGLKINKRTKLFYSGYENYESASKEIENYINRIRKNDISVIKDLELHFAPTGKFQELSMENNWENEFIEMSKIFDNYIK